MRRRKHSEKKHKEMIIRDWLFQEPILKLARKSFNPQPLKQIAREFFCKVLINKFLQNCLKR